MKLINNLYYEALYAHYYHEFKHKPESPLVKKDGSVISDGYRFPQHFFGSFNFPISLSQETKRILLHKEYEMLKNKFNEFPLLEGVEPPFAVYYECFSIRLFLKELIVPHPNGDISVLNFNYHFFRVWYLLYFILKPNKIEKAKFFNARLKSRTIKVMEGVKSPVKNISASEESELESQNISITGNSKTFTVRRQCLAILSFIQASGIKISDLNLTDIARLIHLFSARDIPVGKDNKPQINHSYIYRTLKKIRGMSDEELRNDIFFIKNLYQSITEESPSHLTRKLFKRLISKL